MEHIFSTGGSLNPTIRAFKTGLTFALALTVSLTLNDEAMADADPIEWRDLVDVSAQTYEDPFRELSLTQLEEARTYVRTTQQLASEKLNAERRKALETRLSEVSRSLKEEGVDIDWLISQRWIVAQRRGKAMSAGNPDLDGTEVSLAGFAIPVPPAEDGTRIAYLVPERGMCSHVPPPPPNQLVRLRLSDEWTPSMMHEPVVVSGVISISPSERRTMVVDGLQTLNATFAMEVVEVRTFAQLRAASQSGPVAQYWDKARMGVNLDRRKTGGVRQ